MALELSSIVNCSYFFGVPSFKKYFAKKTIIVTTVVESMDIPAPSIALRTDRKDDVEFKPPLTVEEFYEGYDNFSYQLDEIIRRDTTGEEWGKHLELLGKSNVLFIVNPSLTLTASAKTSLSLDFATNYSMRFGDDGSNGFNFPDCALYDPRFSMMSPNLLNVPYEFVNYIQFFMTASNAVIYLEVR